MAFFHLGLFVDLPLLAFLLAMSVWGAPFAQRAVGADRRIAVVVFLVLAALLISVEENINCGQFGCRTALWPPTAPFLFGVTLVLGLVGARMKVRRVGWFTCGAAVLGLAFEVVLGGSAPAFRALPAGWFLAVSALTLVSYAVIFYLPFAVLFGAFTTTAPDPKPQ